MTKNKLENVTSKGFQTSNLIGVYNTGNKMLKNYIDQTKLEENTVPDFKQEFLPFEVVAD